jgi:hypothetical protein
MSVAIVSFNTLALLRVVCGAVRETAPGADLLVIDTGSMDGSRAWAAARPWCRLELLDHVSPGPAAHAAALDLALARARRPFLVTLDSDAIPIDPCWLDALAEALGGAAGCGTTKDPGELPWPRRLLLRAGLLRLEGPEWSYIRPNCALWRVEALRRLGLSFGGGRVGEALARGLARAGEGVIAIPPGRMARFVLHLRHATMALNPALFQEAPRRALRAARRRIEAFLATPLAERYAEIAEATARRAPAGSPPRSPFS